MKFSLGFGLLFLIVFSVSAKNVVCDADSDCFYIPRAAVAVYCLPETKPGNTQPKLIDTGKRVPALLFLSCTGAKKSDLDSIKFIADSLGWILFSCHQNRNHRPAMQNDRDIMKTYDKAIKQYPIDTNRVFIYGFSGQGVQALMSMFLHPKKFRGVITECAHAQALSLANWKTLKNKLVYLISRQKDWNLNQNYLLHSKFQEHRVRDTLVITPGEHSIGTAKDLFKAVKWLSKNY